MYSHYLELICGIK